MQQSTQNLRDFGVMPSWKEAFWNIVKEITG
jgi:hypothetical protein